jgi:hypothetical protein
MDWYPLVKLVHFMGLIALFGFFVLHSRAGGRLRAATTFADARSSLSLLQLTRPMLPSGVVMLVASGAVMSWMRWRGAYPFVAVGLVAALLMWVVWALSGARHLGAMRAAVENGEGPLPGALVAIVRDPARWGVMGTLNGAALGVLAVMTLKLSWAGSILLVLGLAALVGGAFTLSVRRSRDAAGEGPERRR